MHIDRFSDMYTITSHISECKVNTIKQTHTLTSALVYLWIYIQVNKCLQSYPCICGHWKSSHLTPFYTSAPRAMQVSLPCQDVNTNTLTQTKNEAVHWELFQCQRFMDVFVDIFTCIFMGTWEHLCIHVYTSVSSMVFTLHLLMCEVLVYIELCLLSVLFGCLPACLLLISLDW